MNLSKVNILKSKLDTLAKDEKLFFIQLTHLLNELSILQKCVIFSSNGIELLSTVERRGQVSQALFFIRMLAGKLNEGWEMLKKDFFGKKLSEKYERELSEKSKSISELKRYFSRANNINLIRNSFAFHYDAGKIEEVIDRIPHDEVLEMFISEHSGNCLYSFSDVTVIQAILNSVDPSDPTRAMDLLIDEVAIKVSGWFQEFGANCVYIIGKKLEIDCIEVEIPEPSVIGEIKIPYFVKKSE